MKHDKSTGEILLRTSRNYDRNAASDETGLRCPEPTRTKQEFKEETDINTIVERFGITGHLPTNVRIPLEPDFVEATTYHEALNTILAADEAFMKMPAQIRAEFNNDPGAFITFAEDENNRERAEKLGLVLPKPKQVQHPAEPQKAAQEPPKDTTKGGGVT